MSLIFLSGNLFESDAQTIGHGCNTKGIMSAGIAREFKQRYPYMYEEYRYRCRNNMFNPGGYYLYKDAEPWVLNFATQADRGGAKIEYVEKCFVDFISYYREEGISSLAIPRIAAGLGGLEWQDVKCLLIDILDDIDIPVYVYEKYVLT